MTKPKAPMPPNQNDQDFDLSQIFIGREQQLDLFDMYLTRWQHLMSSAPPDESVVTEAPSPNNKIQGLVVLLYGRGGFGKSTLLKHYRDIALQADRHLTVSKIIDWEFAAEDKRDIFNLQEGHVVEAAEYFKILRTQLVEKLDRKPGDFKQYERAMKDVDKARRQAQNIINSLSRDQQFAPLRWVAGEGLIALLREIPFLRSPLRNEQVASKVKGLVGEGMVITAEQVMLLHDHLRDRLGTQYDTYLDPALRLGLALGRDLHTFARNFPLLIFLDTYEEIDEGDRLLRMVMGTAGLRVGWVIAGRDNLWAGVEQRERNVAAEYGYREIVSYSRGLTIDFNSDEIGVFTLNDIKDYFDRLRRQVSYDSPLPVIDEYDAQSILDVTQGVPLAVKIAAGLYLNKANLDVVTKKIKGKHEIVDQMVQRYLLQVRDNLEDRAKFYALAMLHNASRPAAIATALNLTSEQARTGYPRELARLHRRYSFIFAEKRGPFLHKEARQFLRLWLLERYEQVDIRSINNRLLESHEDELQNLETHRTYSDLKSRLQDDGWVNICLDLAEQHFWINPGDGIQYLLPFMLAAAVYNREIIEDAASIGVFFKEHMHLPYHNWWQWAEESLSSYSSNALFPEELHGLRKLEEQLPNIIFAQMFSGYRQELQAALWWRLGEAYTGVDNEKALHYYKKAFTVLGQDTELKEAMAKLYWDMAYKLYGQKDQVERVLLLTRAIELKPDYVEAYNSRGNEYFDQKEYEKALADYSQAIELDPMYIYAYNNRGMVYSDRREYEKAIADYDEIIKLDSQDADAYHNRGIEYLCIKDIQQAQADFLNSYGLDPNDPNAPWMVEWTSMGRQRVEQEVANRLEKIAEINPQHYVAYVCRAVALALRTKVREGLVEIEKAIPIESQEWDAYFWKGMLCAYYYSGQSQTRLAMEAIEQSLENGLPPVLLTPLYWLEQDRPEFFEKYAKPLLDKYGI